MVCPKWPRLPQHPSLFSTLYPRQAQIVMTFMNAHTGTTWLNSLSSKAVRLFGRRHLQKVARLGLLPRSFGRGRLETKEKQKKTWALESQEKKCIPKVFFWNPFLFCAAGKKIHRCTGVAECERTFEKKSRVIPQKNHGNEHSFGKRKTALVSKAAGSFIFYKPFRVTSFAGFKKTEKRPNPPKKQIIYNRNLSNNLNRKKTRSQTSKPSKKENVPFKHVKPPFFPNETQKKITSLVAQTAGSFSKKNAELWPKK